MLTTMEYQEWTWKVFHPWILQCWIPSTEDLSGVQVGSRLPMHLFFQLIFHALQQGQDLAAGPLSDVRRENLLKNRTSLVKQKTPGLPPPCFERKETKETKKKTYLIYLIYLIISNIYLSILISNLFSSAFAFAPPWSRVALLLPAVEATSLPGPSYDSDGWLLGDGPPAFSLAHKCLVNASVSTHKKHKFQDLPTEPFSRYGLELTGEPPHVPWTPVALPPTCAPLRQCLVNYYCEVAWQWVVWCNPLKRTASYIFILTIIIQFLGTATFSRNGALTMMNYYSTSHYHSLNHN